MKLKTYVTSVLLLIGFLTLVKTACAQGHKGMVNKIAVSGFVKSSITKLSLSDATVGFYSSVNFGLLATTQTNKYGGFSLPKLPEATSIEVRITHAGYASFKKIITVQTGKNTYNFGTIILYPDTLKTNIVKSIDVSNTKNSPAIKLGTIKGKVRDSVYKYVLSTATVAVYNNIDSNLLLFTIPNNLGEFSIQKLPLNTPLKLLITHVGYTPYKKIFSLNAAKSTIDFDWIYMYQNADKENLLSEVTITDLAPVRMNGDTLEFNPRAFKMDANATAEDLMRRLPGMVIWGDGDITFNGKKINSLLVDGKPFMGSSDFTTATQNLPKEVLDKVQIYSQRNDKNPLDSTLNANLKLKADKKLGYFGKIGGGYGTTNRFAADGMLNGYNKKLQISTVGAVNNTNKSANNINTLIRSNSYKGEGNTIEYQSDFKRPGINIGATAGARLQYDFIPAENKKIRRLTADYFFKRNNESINSTRLTNIALKSDSILSNNNVSQSTNINTNSRLSANYLLQDEHYNFTASANADIGQNDNTSKSDGEQTRTGTIGQLSLSNSLNTNSSIQKKMVFETQFNYQKEVGDDDEAKKRKKNLLSSFTIGYRFDYEVNNGSRHNLSSIVSTLNPSGNKFFDRLYQHDNTGNGHTINLSYPNLKKLLFGLSDLGGIVLDLSGRFTFSQNSANSTVFDMNTRSQQYEKNHYLTNNRNENVQDIQPQLSISKNFYKGLTNRYNRRIDIFLIPAMQYYSMESTATLQIQNFRYQYSKFTPRASINYDNHQYGDFEVVSSFSYVTQVNYPTAEYIAPLVDSANVWYIPKGNLNIKPEYTNTFAWKISLESRKPKNPYKVDFSVDGNFTESKISDSTFYDNLGRRITYNVNLNGNKYWHVGSNYRKSYSPNKSHTFRLNVGFDYYSYFIPQYLDSNLITSNNRNNNLEIEVAYSFLDIININAKQVFSHYANLQSSSGLQYNGLNNYTRFSGTLQLPKNLTWSTNINLNTSKAENQPTVHYTIWNARLTYRFTQGNRAEVSFSALDLLKQNKSIINSTNRNVQTFGFNNVLQQYFMLSLAYYPRKFGK